MSLEDQVDHGKQIVTDMYDGPVDYRVVATKGKGERLDRPELQDIEAMLREADLDLLLQEDVGRLVRGSEAVRLWGIAVDHGTRCIAPNDCVDTDDDSWEEDLMAACRDHVKHQTHTSKRLKQKLMVRFRRSGGSTAREPAGYLKPEGAKTYDEWLKDESAESAKQPKGEWTIVEAGRRLKKSLNCSEIAEWLNEVGFRPGKYCRNKEWDGRMVRRFFGNPILKGFPQRGAMRTEKHHETGRRRSVKNPDGPSYYECPHLAYFDPAEFDELNRLLYEANQQYRRKTVDGKDPRARVPRKRTRFPGQHSQCHYCGHHCVWGGNGMTDNLMCSNSRNWHCWNSVGFNGEMFSRKLLETLRDALGQLDGIEDQYRDMVLAALNRDDSNVTDRQKKLRQREADHQRAWSNITSAIKEFGALGHFKAEIELLKNEETEILIEKTRLEGFSRNSLVLPDSIDQLRQMIDEEFDNLTIDSSEFCDLMRLLVPDVHIHLVRLCDGGHLLPRARVRLDLLGSIEDAAQTPNLKAALSQVKFIDAFEPPQRERIRLQSVQLSNAGHGPKKIARLLPEKPKYQAVCKALELQQLMDEAGLKTPYVFVDSPPEDYKKLRRHKNSKYRFQPLEEYEPPKI
ncbi:MAG: recombinase family protein [Planctomycetaceae bacterium]|nr:recombinase family protein [Planctomycetaceae bacterium]